MDNLDLYIESLIFASNKAMTVKSIKGTLNEYLDKSIKEKEIITALESLVTKYNDEKYPFEIIEISGGYQFMTKGTYYPLVSQYLKIESKKKLSKAALETLAIISYKQPVTKSVMESIRGVGCDYAIQKLLDKELIEIAGRAEGPGRPLLYGTSEKFMNHFGLKDLNDLPKIKEFEIPDNEIGIKDTDDQPEPAQQQEAVAEDQDETNDVNNEGADDQVSQETIAEPIDTTTDAAEVEQLQDEDSTEEPTETDAENKVADETVPVNTEAPTEAIEDEKEEDKPMLVNDDEHNTEEE